MKIAYLGIKSLPAKAGTDRVVEAIIRRLAADHSVTVYCDLESTPYGALNGVKIIRIPTIKGKYAQATSLYILSALHALIAGNYDLIHINGVDTSFVSPLLRLHYKVISTSHGSPTRVPRKKWGRVAQFLIKLTEYPFIYFSNYATSVSLTDKRYYEARYGRKVFYIPNGVDETIIYDMAAGAAELHKHGIEPGNFILFAAGRIDPTKGCHLAVEAFNQSQLDIPLVIIGDLEQVPEYGRALRKLALSRPISFIQPISNRELLFGIVKLCKLFIFPSLGEAMSLMLLEAGSLGVPIICSDIPENKEVMGDSALYFQSGNVQSLAQALKWALEHPSNIEELSVKIRSELYNRFPWEKITRCYQELYRACIMKSQPPEIDFE